MALWLHLEDFIAGMHAIAKTIAADAPVLIVTQGVWRILDVGGGPATFAFVFAQANSEF